MSFSEYIKNELCELKEENENNKLAILASFIKLSGNLVIRNSSLEIELRTENPNIAKYITELSMDVLKTEPRFTYHRNMRLNKNPYYILSINKDPIGVLKRLEIMDNEGRMNSSPSLTFVKNKEFLRCYLRGAFIANGSINDPYSRGGYHFEISTLDEEFALYLRKLINEYDLKAKISKRRNTFIVYLKKGESIGDFLRIINSMDGLMQFEDCRISKDMINNTNRVDNCDLANEMKRSALAQKQIEAINVLIKKELIENLDFKTQKIIQYRIDNPEWALSDIANAYNEDNNDNMSKSSVRTILLKVIQLAEDAQHG
jgi:DNA-binding protein WhiA